MTEDTCVFPLYNETLIQFLLDDTARVKGSALIDKDLRGLINGNTSDKENNLSNFTVDGYF